MILISYASPFAPERQKSFQLLFLAAQHSHSTALAVFGYAKPKKDKGCPREPLYAGLFSPYFRHKEAYFKAPPNLG
jgi:hypothetical protein